MEIDFIQAEIKGDKNEKAFKKICFSEKNCQKRKTT